MTPRTHIHETLLRDPRSVGLANKGQARITSEQSDDARRELRAELETFVCDGEYGRAVTKVLNAFVRAYGQPRQDAVWVSGFFGSGKSHLLKILGHLWANTAFPDGATARGLVRELPDDARAALKEIDTYAKRAGVPVVAVAGALTSGGMGLVRTEVLGLVFRALDLPETIPHARFCLWLLEKGWYDQVCDACQTKGRGWAEELSDFHVGSVIAGVLRGLDPSLGADVAAVRAAIRAQFAAPPQGDVSTSIFLELLRRALTLAPATGGTGGGTGGKRDLPLTLLILDEVQQYLGDVGDRSTVFTEVAEAVQTQLAGRVMLVASGQSALAGITTHGQKLRDRFRVQIHLSDADVEAVTRKVLLVKNPSGEPLVRQNLDQNAGEVSRHLRESRIGPRAEDHGTLVADYPLLPTRRRFFEAIIREVDLAGTSGQLRSQLRILHDALSKVAGEPLGALIPGDELFEALTHDLVNRGVMLNEISTRIQRLDDGSAGGKLRRRIAGLVFLISKLKRETALDLGVRATPAMVADLLVSDLNADSGALRSEVARQLEAMAREGLLLKVGEEYRHQTTEGTEWDRAFQESAHRARQNELLVGERRAALLNSAVAAVVDGIRLTQGATNQKRTLRLHASPTEPPTGPAGSVDAVYVWLRDQWSASEAEVVEAAKRRGQSDPTLFVFLERRRDEELKDRIVEMEAAQAVLNLKGVPAAKEGEEARASMESRRLQAERQLSELVRGVLQSAHVFQGGGNEVYEGADLAARLLSAGRESLVRLYPRFSEGDHPAYEVALKRAREGSDDPLQVVNWTRPTVEHPVAKEVLASVGAGETGAKVRKRLTSPPFGWPQDAIDAVLVALVKAGVLKALHNGQLQTPAMLEQTRIGSSEFRPERRVLTTTQRLDVRGLLQKAGIAVRAGEEELKAGPFLEEVLRLAQAGCGSPPLPEPRSLAGLDDLRRLTGSEQLAALLDKKTELEAVVQGGRARQELFAKRWPEWQRLLRMARHADGLPVAAEVAPQVQALQSQRALLEGLDPVTPLLAKLSGSLRTTLTTAEQAFALACRQAADALRQCAPFQRLAAEEQEALLRRHGLIVPGASDLSTDDGLLDALDGQGLRARDDARAAISERRTQALAEATKVSEPKAKVLRLRSATLANEADVRAWVSEQERILLEAVKQGPVVLG